MFSHSQPNLNDPICYNQITATRGEIRLEYADFTEFVPHCLDYLHGFGRRSEKSDFNFAHDVYLEIGLEFWLLALGGLNGLPLCLFSIVPQEINLAPTPYVYWLPDFVFG